MNKYRLLLSNIYRFFFPIDEVTKFRKMGIRIGENCKIQNEVMIDYSHNWLVTIGNNVTLAPRVHILAHDASAKRRLNYAKLGLTTIEDDVFVGAGAIVLPGVTIKKGSIVGAGSIVANDVPENVVVAGNPAKVICTTEEYYTKIKNQMCEQNTFDESYTTRKNVSPQKKQEMIGAIEKYGCAFVE